MESAFDPVPGVSQLLPPTLGLGRGLWTEQGEGSGLNAQGLIVRGAEALKLVFVGAQRPWRLRGWSPLLRFTWEQGDGTQA